MGIGPQQIILFLYLQLAETSLFLRLFKIGVTKEFLLNDTKVHSDWKEYALSLTWLMGPPFRFLERTTVDAPGLRDISKKNFARLVAIHRCLKDAYSYYCEKATFAEARNGLLKRIEISINICEEWISRLHFDFMSYGSLNVSARKLIQERSDLRNVALRSGDAPKQLRDLRAALKSLRACIDVFHSAINTQQLELFRCPTVEGNPLFELCMASRKVVVVLFFRLITQKDDEADVECVKSLLEDARTCVQAARDQIIWAEHVDESMELLTTRVKVVEALCKNGGWELLTRVGVALDNSSDDRFQDPVVRSFAEEILT